MIPRNPIVYLCVHKNWNNFPFFLIVPTLNKERKTLSSLLLDYDAAKSRLVNYRQKEGSGNYCIVLP